MTVAPGTLLDLRIANMRRKMRFKMRQVNTKVLIVLMSFFASVAFSEDFKTTDGKEYKDATVVRVEADGIVVKMKSGISKLYFVELPKEVQDRYHYDPGKAAAAHAVQEQISTAQALQARYEELERQEDDLELTIGQAEVGTYSGYPNPLRSQLPYLHNRLDEVRREKDLVRKELEKAQRAKQ